jgi:hypothetical protein
MTRHRRIVLTGLIIACLPAAAPALAAANSALSGYGGPGEGSQAIIGSALLGGGSGGGGGGGGSTGGPSDGSSGSSRYGEPPGTETSQARANGATGAASKHAVEGSGSQRTRAGETSGDGASAYPAVSAEETSAAASVGSQTLGLSDDDLLYILVAFAGLALTGILTRQLARTKGSGGHQTLKGWVAGPE